MKTNSYRWLLLSAVSVCASFLMACQKDSGGGASVSPAGDACGANLITSQYGCIPTAGCNAGMGMFQNQCIVVNNGGACTFGAQMVNGQCLPTQGTCQSGFIWSGSSCVFATTGQPFPQQAGFGFQQPYFQQFPQAQPFPLYGGLYGYSQGGGFSQPFMYPGFGNSGLQGGFSIGFGY